MNSAKPVLKSLAWLDKSLKFINQAALPQKLEFIQTQDYRIVLKAIKNLQIRGAPAIGIAAAYAAVLAAQEGIEREKKHFRQWMERTCNEIESARPTARNLFFAVEHMRKIVDGNKSSDANYIRQRLQNEADRLYHEDIELCRKIGEFGAKLINDGDKIVTHCNTGMLVTAGIGTALGVIYTALREGKKVHVFADETRPLFQGARLTTWECQKSGIPVTLICDATAAELLRKGKVDCAIVGADRIAANGDVANKIGTYSLAVNCSVHNIPFYVAAPYSTFDFSLKSGDEIPIEERSEEEVTRPYGVVIVPDGIPVYNPAFDITPADLITAIITDAGIFRPPYGEWGNLIKVE